jgi:hypothetical protein
VLVLAIRKEFPRDSARYTDVELDEAIKAQRGEVSGVSVDPIAAEPSDDEEFRRKEYVVLRRSHDGREGGGWLKTESSDVNRFSSPFKELLAELTLVHKLRETRAFSGFSRLMAERPSDALPVHQMLYAIIL